MKKTGKNRTITDKFYTCRTIAKKCVEDFKSFLPKENILLIEPSAGKGVFLPFLVPYSFLAFDIEPAG
ncbi:unnamed protein product, partial [marine sediment metagenome]